jgi:hypothetical protein
LTMSGTSPIRGNGSSCSVLPYPGTGRVNHVTAIGKRAFFSQTSQVGTAEL